MGHLGTVQPLYWLANAILYYILLGLMLLFFRSMKLAMLSFHGLVTVAVLADYYVDKLRGRPFMLQDIRSASTAARVIGGYTFDMEPSSAVCLTVMVSLFLVAASFPAIRLNRFHLARKALTLAALSIAIFLISSESFMGQFRIMGFSQWDVAGNYASKGYGIALLAQAKYCRREKPACYSVENVHQIVEQYLKAVPATETAMVSPTNLIIVMNESWADLRVIGPFELDDTITPYMDRLSENVIKGFLHVPVFGAGTANSEYEVLTGNSMQFLGPGNTAYTLYTTNPEYGMATTLKAQGYAAIALHPYLATNWSRQIVYPRMGFDAFYSEPDWPEELLHKISWCMSDKGSYDMLIRQYENKSSSGDSLFSFLVTMQNHGGYGRKDYESTVNLGHFGEYPYAEQYLSLIRETDAAFQYLIEYFAAVEEPTMIVMFGDHLPNIDESFYERLLGYSMDKRTSLDWQRFYTTPFIIWANYDIEERDGIEMSSNYLGSYVLQLAGLEMSDYQKCLLAFAQEIPVIGTGLVMDNEGNWYPIGEMPDQLRKIYEDYEVLQYNNVFGGRNRIAEAFMVSEYQ